MGCCVSLLWNNWIDYSLKHPSLPAKTVEVAEEIEWIKGNADGNFYYMVSYEDATWTALAKALEDGDLTEATDKTSLVYDVFNLAG